MKWERMRFVGPILAGAGAGFLVAFLTIRFWPDKVFPVEELQAYDILKHLTVIIMVFMSVFGALGGLLIGWLLQRTLYAQLSSRLISEVQKQGNCILTDLHKATASLWGKLYEQFKKDELIEIALTEGKKATQYAEGIDEKEHWGIKLMAFNNYLMCVTLRGSSQDVHEAHLSVGTFERIAEQHEKDLGNIKYQNCQETIYFTHWRFPLSSKDKKKAEKDFLALKGHPYFDSWMQRWESCGFKASSP